VGIFTTQVTSVLKLVLRVLILLKIVLEEDCARNNKFRQLKIKYGFRSCSEELV